MSKIERDRPDMHRDTTFVTLGEALGEVQDKIIADGVKAARAEKMAQMSVVGTVGGPVGVPVGETTAKRNDRVDSQPLDPALTIRRLTNELAQARLVTAQALADVAAARNALELSIRHQDQRHTEAMAKQKACHDAKVAELDGMITMLVGKLTQSRKDHDAVLAAVAQSVAPRCPVDAVEWVWNQPAGLLPRVMR